MEIKQSTSFRVPVALFDGNGNAVTGVAFGSVTAYLQKQAGAAAAKTVTTDDWFEVDATNLPGHYDLLLSTTDTNTVGFLKYMISVSGADRFVSLIEVVANLEADTFARVGAPAGASVSADVAAVKVDSAAIKLKTDNLPAAPASTGDVTGARDSIKGGNDVGQVYARIGAPAGASLAADVVSVKADVLQARKILEGRWKISSVTNTLTIYDTDGTTALLTFNLKDETGVAAWAAGTVYERISV